MFDMDCETVREHLRCHYGVQRVICRIGTSDEMEYNASGAKHFDTANMAVYIHSKYRIAVVWNMEARRKYDQVITNFSISGKWENVLPNRALIRAVYRTIGKNIDILEKVLILDLDVLDDICDMLHVYLQINSKDNEYSPNGVNSKDVLPEDIRNRVSTSCWERDYTFRTEVLNAYGVKCAICRCTERALLQAAHIKAVADGGSDDVSNGICLCANHHIMFDRKLIKIDFDKKTLTDVNESVKGMPWYNKFMELYNGKILGQTMST